MADDTIRLTLDGREVTAHPGETLWQVAWREGQEIPHLCYKHAPGYRADGNCRACMVEIEGERALAASCIRKARADMVVHSGSDRARRAQKGVMELLLADQPGRAQGRDPNAELWRMADMVAVTESRYPAYGAYPAADLSHTAMNVNLDACIHCNLCVRACREVQVNDVIGMAGRGETTKVVFDFDDPMGESTCVACGECVQACPTGALMPASVMDEAQRGDTRVDRDVDSVCPYCGVGCQLTYKIRDDKIAWVEGQDGPANRNRLCVKGRFGFDYIDHDDRLTMPLIRREDAPKRADLIDSVADPTTLFREASWEEALDLAARGLTDLRCAHGGHALAGFGSAKCSNEEAYLFQKLVRTGFGSNNVDHCTRLCHASSVAALMENIGSGAVTAPFNTVLHSDVAIVIGANPTENHPVAATFFKQARKRGTKFVVIDPRGQGLRDHADHMIQNRPGTDVALLNAMMHVIVEEELTDPGYIATHTRGFDAMKAHLAQFAPEAMAATTGIDADTLREVARLYATAERAIIFWGMGISQHIHGTDNSRCLISLALMTGQVGREGTGLHPLRGQNNVQGASDAGLIPMVFPDYKATGDTDWRAKLEKAWQTDLDPEPGLTVVEIMHAIHAGSIRGMYILGENPAMSDPDLRHARQAMAQLDHLVVQDLFLTETAYFADVVLPASAWPEKSGTVSNTNRQVQMGRKALDCPGQAREDWWITQEIARRMGLDWHYDGPAEIFAEMKTVMPSLDNITWERLEAEGSITYPCPAPDHEGSWIVFSDSFPTRDGRGSFTPASLINPDETPDLEYPLVLTTGRQLEHWHTGAMTRRARHLDALEPVATAALGPGQMKKLGIRPGDRIKVATRRGEIELVARVDRAVPFGTVFIPFAFAEAAANILTNPALDPYGKIPEYKFCAARVEKVADRERITPAAE